MRVSVASILALLILALACVDPLCCSDECERGGMTATHSTQTGADCPSCLSAVVPFHDLPVVHVDIVTRVRDRGVPAPTLPFRADVDHPPRLA